MAAIKNKKRSGFTLAEAMIATVILAAAAAGVLLPFASGQQLQAEGSNRTLAAKLASDLMERVINAQFDQLISNYNFSESQGQLTDATGSYLTGSAYSKFSRKCSCEYYTTSEQDSISELKFIRVTIAVYYDSKPMVTLRRLIAN